MEDDAFMEKKPPANCVQIKTVIGKIFQPKIALINTHTKQRVPGF